MVLHAAEVPADNVSLSWNPNPESDVAGYKVRFGTTSGVYPQIIDTGRETTAVLPQMMLGRTYYMTVSAYNMAGLEGTRSAELVVNPTLPQPVEKTTFSLTGSGQGEVRWTYPTSAVTSAVTSADRFTIYSSENLSEWSFAGSTQTIAGSTYTFRVPLVAGKPQMFFRVSAVNPFGESR